MTSGGAHFYVFDEIAKPLDERETPIKGPVPTNWSGEDETLYKRPLNSSGNTVRDDSAQYTGMRSPDSMETPYKGVLTDDVFFAGSVGRSLDEACTTDAVPSRGSSRNRDSDKDDYGDKNKSSDVRPKEVNFQTSTSDDPPLHSPTKVHDIKIDEHVEFPFELRAEHYDMLILNHADDLQRAINLKKIFQKFCLHKDDTPVKVLVLGDDDHEFVEITQRIHEMGEASKRCTMCFMLMSPAFCEDEFFRLMKDEFLWESITDEKKKWSVIPLHTSQKYKVPFGLSSLKGVQIETDIVSGINLDDEELDLDDPKVKPKTGFMKSVCPMLCKKVHLRREREEELAGKREEYRETELHKRRLAALREKTDRLRRQKLQERELKAAEERNKQRANEPLPPSAVTPEKELIGATFKERAANYQVHVTQNNYIGALRDMQLDDDDEEDDEIDWASGNYEVVRGNRPDQH